MHLASNIYIGKNAEAAQDFLDRGFALAKEIKDPNVERTVITGTIISHFYSGRYKSAVKIYETFEPLFAEKYPLHKLSLRMGVLMGVSYAYSRADIPGVGPFGRTPSSFPKDKRFRHRGHGCGRHGAGADVNP